VTFGGDLQALNDHFGGLVAPHGIHGQGKRTGHRRPDGRTRATPGPGLRPGQRPAAASRLRPLRARRNGHNGCIRDGAASARHNSCIPRAPRASAPDGCDACPRATGRFFFSVRPWDSAPSLTTCASRTARGMTDIHDWTKTRAAPSSRASAPSQWLMEPGRAMNSSYRRVDSILLR
jgi:hypothetical protein